ncbi:MAG: stage 0 sporulation protein [Candidatus Hydrogenedentes bacterium]|nr:stage 0 sporulation protein [Candidatus Hydrogenedentota bacterium]
MQTVRVRLRKPTRVFTFMCADIPLKRNDSCIVRSDRGLEYGTCIVPPEPFPDEARQPTKMSVVRKATYNDEANFREIEAEEDKARAVCSRKIAERNLQMKLVDVEYTFDRHKVIFYFTAAERVDFRQLVRDLAQELRARIELRHIQVRDEAKLVGGLGVCGRELCCGTWMREFKPISMKMAKRQNLSLNPSKISGQCGRLLCCLEYENDLYRKRRNPDQQPASGPPCQACLEHEPDEDDDASSEAAEVLIDDSYDDGCTPDAVPALDATAADLASDDEDALRPPAVVEMDPADNGQAGSQPGEQAGGQAGGQAAPASAAPPQGASAEADSSGAPRKRPRRRGRRRRSKNRSGRAGQGGGGQ